MMARGVIFEAAGAHMGARTTITLDHDVVEAVTRQSTASGRSFGETLNELLRMGLVAAEARAARPPLRLPTANLGEFPDLNYDCTGELLEYAEGPDHR